jgi:hypothetical protein
MDYNSKSNSTNNYGNEEDQDFSDNQEDQDFSDNQETSEDAEDNQRV